MRSTRAASCDGRSEADVQAQFAAVAGRLRIDEHGGGCGCDGYQGGDPVSDAPSLRMIEMRRKPRRRRLAARGAPPAQPACCTWFSSRPAKEGRYRRSAVPGNARNLQSDSPEPCPDTRGRLSRIHGRDSLDLRRDREAIFSQNRVTFLKFLSILSACLYLHAGIFRALSVAANKRPACLEPVS